MRITAPPSRLDSRRRPRGAAAAGRPGAAGQTAVGDRRRRGRGVRERRRRDGKIIASSELDEVTGFLKDAAGRRQPAELARTRRPSDVALDSLMAAAQRRVTPAELADIHGTFVVALGVEGALDLPTHAVDLARGKKIFELDCVPCHGPRGAGDGPGARRHHPAAGTDRQSANDARRLSRADLPGHFGGHRGHGDAAVGGDALAGRSLGGRDLRELAARERRRPRRRSEAAQGATAAVVRNGVAARRSCSSRGRPNAATRRSSRRSRRRHRGGVPSSGARLSAAEANAGGGGAPRRAGRRGVGGTRSPVKRSRRATRRAAWAASSTTR